MLKIKDHPNLYTIAISLMVLAVLSLLGLGKTASQDIIASPIEDIDWNRDNTLLALAHNNGVLEIVNLLEQSSVAFDISPFALIDLSWSPVDNTVLAVVIQDGTTKLINISDGEYTVIHDLVGELEYIRGIAWNADGTRLITIGSSGTGAGQISKAIVWDTANGDRLATYEDGFLPTDVFWNLREPSQVILAEIGDEGTARILAWDALADTVIWLTDEPDAAVLSLATSPQGDQFVSAMNMFDGAVVRVHDSSTGTVQSVLETNIQFVGALAWNPGPYLAISDRGGIQIWDVNLEHFMTAISAPQIPFAIGWSRDGEKFAYGSVDGGVIIYEKTDLTPAALTSTPSATSTPIALNSIYSLAWSPDGRKIAVGMGTDYCHTDNSNLYDIQILDTATKQIVATLPGSQCSVVSLDWSPDGTRLASASLDYDRVRVWNTSTGEIQYSAQRRGQGSTSVRWSPDGTKLANTAISNGIGIWDAKTGEPLSLAPIGGTVIDWNPDGSKLVSGSAYENQVYVADMINEQPLMNLSGHTDLISAVDWSPDGSKLASGSADATVRIWDAITGAALLALQGHTDFVTQVAWSPDSSKIASSSDDGTVRIWNASTGEQLQVIQGNGRIFAVTWNPNGREIAYGGLNDTLQIVSVSDTSDS